MATWTVGAARDLPIAERETWDGPAAAAGVFAWAGWPENPDSGRARRAFLLYDADAPELKGSYKLPFAQVTEGRLVASRAGLRAAASRLPQTDAEQEALDRARSVLDGYFKRLEEAALTQPMMEIKTVTELRTVNERVVTGFPSVFGNVDDGGDLIEPGAYQKTLAERGPRMRWLWQHDRNQPPTAKILAIAEVGREALPADVLTRYPEATGGLMVQREYLDTPRGNEVLQAIRSGALNEMSIGYDAIKAEYPRESLLAGRSVQRVLKEIRLWEMSDVNWGMNAATANFKAAIWLDAPAEEIAEQLRAAGRLEDVLRADKDTQRQDAAVVARDLAQRQALAAERRRRLALFERTLEL